MLRPSFTLAYFIRILIYLFKCLLCSHHVLLLAGCAVLRCKQVIKNVFSGCKNIFYVKNFSLPLQEVAKVVKIKKLSEDFPRNFDQVVFDSVSFITSTVDLLITDTFPLPPKQVHPSSNGLLLLFY